MAEIQDPGKSAADQVTRIIEDDQGDLVELCLDLANTLSPHGKERAVASKVVDWFKANNIQGWLQPITERSANAVGWLPGVEDGTSLIFDAHMDTGPELPPSAAERLRRISQAWVENDIIYGWGVVNDKGQLAAFMIAARALAKAGIRLKGDLYIAGVAFETGYPSVGERQGIDYPGTGFGTWWLVNRGVTADYALVGETSGFGLITVECGELYLEISTRGRSIYTPRMERGSSLQEHPSSAVRMGHIVQALEEWAVRYQKENRLEFEGGAIVPKVQILSVHGDSRESRLRLDIMLVPGANPRKVKADVQKFLKESGFDCEVSAYQWSRGYFAKNAEPLIDAVRRAHRGVLGNEPPRPPTEEVSMWRDVNFFNEVGIPSICYGPPRQQELMSDSRNRCMKIADLVAATKVYALTAMNLCGLAKEPTSVVKK